MSLLDTQIALSGWIRAPEGVARALEDQDRVMPDGPAASARRRLESLIRGNEALDAVGRLEIYANAYFHRIHGVLAGDFPALQRALGEDHFHDLVTSYLLVEPSRHPSLRRAGNRLPEFLATHEAAAGLRRRAAWAADLAAFEWSHSEVFDATDQAVLAREDLVALAPDDFASLPLKLVDALVLAGFEYPVDRIWRAALSSESVAEVLEPARPKTELIVWRKSEAVRHRRLDPVEWAALARVEIGACFADLCEWTAAEVNEATAPALAASWLERWISDELLRGLD